MEPYVLYSQRRKKGRRRLDSDLTINAHLHPAEEALLDFTPETNEIDGKLYDGIVATSIAKQKPVYEENSMDRSNLQIHIDEIEKQPARHSRFVVD